MIIKYNSTTDDVYKKCPKKAGVYKMFDTAKNRVTKVLTVTGQENKVDQSYKDLTTVKNLVARTEAKGLLRANVQFEGELDDFPNYDFMEAQTMMAKATQAYDAMPDKVRSRFKNAAEFMQFANDPTNAPEMIKMGLRKAIDGRDHTGASTGADLTNPGEVRTTPPPTPQ